MPPRVSLPKRRAGFAKRERRRRQNAPVSCGRRAIPRNPLITKVFSKAWTMPSMRDRAVSRFFSVDARTSVAAGRESMRGIGARRRSGASFVATTRSRRPRRRIDDSRRPVRAVAFLFRPLVSPNGSRARRRPILDSSGAMHIFFGQRRKFGLGRGRKRKNRESLANRFANDSPMEIGFATRNFLRARFFDSFVASIACHAAASDRCREVEPSPSPRVSRRRRRSSRSNSLRASKTAGPACDFRLGPRFRPSARLAIPGQAPYFPAQDGIVPSKTRHYPRSGSLPA